MKRTLGLLITLFLLQASASLAQKDPAHRSAIAGNEAFAKAEYKKALEHFEKAEEEGMQDLRLRFNKGNTLFRLEKYADAATAFEGIARSAEEERLRANAYNNLGNAQMKAGKLEKSIEAYENALRIDPMDEETRYNLALAKKLQKEKEKQDEKKKDQKKDQKQNQQNKDGEGKDQKEQDQQGDKKKKGNKEQEQNKGDDKKKGGNKEGEKQKGEERRMSPQEVERLLRAMENNEKEVQQKILRKKRKKEGKEKDVEKDW